MTHPVLLVDDDEMVREALGQTLELDGFAPILARSFIEAKDHISSRFKGVIVSDIRMPGKSGFDLLAHVQSIDPDLPVILLTGEGDIPMAVRGMSEGAFDFLEKPCENRQLLSVVGRACRTRSLVLENRSLRSHAQKGDAASRMLFGESRQAEELRKHVRMAARSNADLLICGEAGTGTSKVAEVVHLLSEAANGPFIKRAAAGLNASGLQDAFERAGGGSLFLDEISVLDPATQFELLEILDKGADTRVIGGSFQPMEVLAQAGKFNSELYYHLDSMRIRIPALRERKDDIPVLFRHYVAQASEQAALDPPEISQEVVGQLMAQDWPGNARALMNTAMRFSMGLGLGIDNDGTGGGRLGLNEQLMQVERTLLSDALRRSSGRATAAAGDLKLPRKTFYDRLARHGIRPEDFR